MQSYDFSAFSNVELIGANLSAMDDEQLAVLWQQARYCQAMTEAVRVKGLEPLPVFAGKFGLMLRSSP